MARLNPHQRAILARMAVEQPGADCLTANWIAEGCGHFYDTPWASGRLPALIKRGLVERVCPGWYRITSAGRAALLAQPPATEGEN